MKNLVDKSREDIYEFLYEFRDTHHLMGASKEVFFKYLSVYNDDLLFKLFERKMGQVISEQKNLIEHESFKNQ